MEIFDMSASQLTVIEFQQLLEKRVAESPAYATIASKLRQHLWDQDCGDITLRFYERLQNEAIIHGEPVRRAIRSCASAAISARSPVRYFAASVTRRLREQGYLQDGGEEMGL